MARQIATIRNKTADLFDDVSEAVHFLKRTQLDRALLCRTTSVAVLLLRRVGLELPCR